MPFDPDLWARKKNKDRNDPNLRERGKELTAKITGFLAPLGFSETTYHSAWYKPLDCGLVVAIHNLTNERNATVKVNVHLPAGAGETDFGRPLLEGCLVGVIADTWTRRLPERIGIYSQKAEEREKVRCPHCGGYMVERTVRKQGASHHGEIFLGCINYPDCRGIRADWKSTIADDEGKWVDIQCPECARPLAIRYTKTGPNAGRRFYGCTGYPKDCKTIVGEEEAMALKMMPRREPPQQPDGGFDFTKLTKKP